MIGNGWHRKAEHVHGTFGADAFGLRAEAFARAFGTPRFLLAQTALVIVWIIVNVVAATLRWDPYPFILLNLAFSIQAAYAAPLILLAQTRQAERDRAMNEADAAHREALAQASLDRQDIASRQAAQIHELLETNTALTRQVEQLTREMHAHITASTQ